MLAATDIPALSDVEAELRLRRLVDFIPHLTPEYAPPHHLAPLLRRFELAIEGKPQRVCCSGPPQHGKSDSTVHVIPFGLRRFPHLCFSYSTYADRLSRKKSRQARALTLKAGVKLATTNVNQWTTPEGGGLIAGGVGGPLTGNKVDILIVDDPIKNRLEAESQTYRERLNDWWDDVAQTRLGPKGSAFVFATRWTEDDLIGRLVKERGFEYINLPALSDDGVPLWPAMWTREGLEKRRADVGEYTWASLYQGMPRPRGGRVFEGVTTYSELPTSYRTAFGLDGAYTAKKSSDYSARVRMVAGPDGVVYVVDARRAQVRADVWTAECRQDASLYPAASWRWYVSTTEQGVAHLMASDSIDAEGTRLPGVPVTAMLAKGDKFVRAQAYAAAWNAGRVRVPERAPWLQHFIAEHAGFTGAEGGVDDVVDAAVAAYDELQTGGERIGTELPPSSGFSNLRSVRM